MVQFHPQTFYTCSLSNKEISRLLDLNPQFASILTVLPEQRIRKLVDYWTTLPPTIKTKYSSYFLNYIKKKGCNFPEKSPDFTGFIFRCVKANEDPRTIAKLIQKLKEQNLLKNFSGETLVNLQSILICNNSKNCHQLLKLIGGLK